jgi:hypothetical protein
MKFMPTAESITRANSEVHPTIDLLKTDPNSDTLLTSPLIRALEDAFQQPAADRAPIDLIKQPIPEQVGHAIYAVRPGIRGRIEEKVVPLKQASAEDWRDSKNKLHVISSWLGFIGLRVVGRPHLPTVAISYASMDVLAATHSTPLTALTAMAASTAWSRFAAGTMNRVIDHNPKTFRAAGDLSVSRQLGDALPGLRSYTPADQPEAGSKRGKRDVVSTHVRRGFVATNKLTPYISAAGREGQTRAERRKLAWALSVDAGAVEGLMFAGIAKAIMTFSGNDENVAKSIEHGIKNPVVWSMLGSIMMVSEFTKNKISQRRAARQLVKNHA